MAAHGDGTDVVPQLAFIKNVRWTEIYEESDEEVQDYDDYYDEYEMQGEDSWDFWHPYL